MAQSKSVRFGEIAWLPEFNNRKEYGTFDGAVGIGAVPSRKGVELALSLADQGWKMDAPPTATDIVPDEYIPKILAWRKQYLELLADVAGKNEKWQIALGAVVSYLKQEWYTSKDDGKTQEMVIPTYLGITGNRRASVFPFAVAFRRIGRIETVLEEGGKVPVAMIEKLDPSYSPTIPVIVEHLDPVKDAEEIYSYQTRENADDTYRKPYTKVEKANIGFRLYKSGANQAKFRKIWSSGDGVGLYILARLNYIFPQLNIAARINMPDKIGDGPNPECINVGALRNNELQEVQLRLDSLALAAENKARKAKNEDLLEEMTVEDVNAYLKSGKLRDKRVKAMPASQALDHAIRSQVEIVKAVVTAMRDSNLDVKVNDWMLRSKGYNLLWSMTPEQYDLAVRTLENIVAPPAPQPEAVPEVVAAPEPVLVVSGKPSKSK